MITVINATTRKRAKTCDTLAGVIYEWDAAKASANLRKHKISFAEAASVFLDPLALSFSDLTIRKRRTAKSPLASLRENEHYSYRTVNEASESA